MGIRDVLQIVCEVYRQSRQDFCLAIEQATFGMLGGRPGGLEIDAVESKFGFQPLDFGSRRGRRRWSLDVHNRGGRSSERRNAVIIYVARDGDAAWLRACGIQRGGRACA